MSILKYMYLCIISIYSVLQKLEDDFCKISYSTRNVIFYNINDRIGLTHDTIEYTHDITRFTHDTIGLIYDRIG